MTRIRRPSGRAAVRRSVVAGSLLGAIWTLLWRVEDGQFEREYSRLFAAVVLGGALLALVIVGSVVSLLLRLVSRRGRGT